MSDKNSFGVVSSDTSSNDPKMLNSRVFIGNLPSEKVTRREVEAMFAVHGTVLGVSLHKSYGFVQFDNEENAKSAVGDIHGKTLEGNVLDVNLAALRRKEGTSIIKSTVDQQKSKAKSSSNKTSNKTSSSESRSHHSSSRYHEERSRRDRSRDRSRERERDRLYRRRSRSPPYMPHDMDYRARFRPMDRMHDYPPPPFREPFFDFPPPRDPYFYSRDDIFDVRDRYPMPPPGRMRDPFGLPDLYERMSPIPLPRDRDLRDREPRDREPRDRDSRDREPRYDDLLRPLRPRSYSPLPKKDFASSLSTISFVKGEKPSDMEIIVVNRQQKEYADLICGRVKFFGLVVETVNLSHTVSLVDALDAAANRGLLYAIIVTSQHELHRSVTLTILHGRNPQEHKNMPLEDALALVDRDFQCYTVDVREGRVPPRRQKNELSSLLSQAASGGQLSTEQLQQVIDALQKQKQQSNETQLLQQPATQPQAQLPPKDDIQRQQADLQAKILSLLGSNAVVPSSTSQHSSRAAPHSGYDNVSANGRGGEGLGISGYGDASGMRVEDGGGRGYSHGSFGSGY